MKLALKFKCKKTCQYVVAAEDERKKGVRK